VFSVAVLEILRTSLYWLAVEHSRAMGGGNTVTSLKFCLWILRSTRRFVFDKRLPPRRGVWNRSKLCQCIKSFSPTLAGGSVTHRHFGRDPDGPHGAARAGRVMASSRKRGQKFLRERRPSALWFPSGPTVAEKGSRSLRAQMIRRPSR